MLDYRVVVVSLVCEYAAFRGVGIGEIGIESERAICRGPTVVTRCAAQEPNI